MFLTLFTIDIIFRRLRSKLVVSIVIGYGHYERYEYTLINHCQCQSP